MQESIADKNSSLRKHLLKTIILLLKHFASKEISTSLATRSRLNVHDQKIIDDSIAALPRISKISMQIKLRDAHDSFASLNRKIAAANNLYRPSGSKITDVDYYVLAKEISEFNLSKITMPSESFEDQPTYEDRARVSNALPTNLFVPALAKFWRDEQSNLYMKNEILKELKGVSEDVCDKTHLAVLHLSTALSHYKRRRDSRHWMQRLFYNKTREKQTNDIIESCNNFLSTNIQYKSKYLGAINNTLATITKQTTRSSFLSWLGFGEKKIHAVIQEHKGQINKHVVAMSKNISFTAFEREETYASITANLSNPRYKVPGTIFRNMPFDANDIAYFRTEDIIRVIDSSLMDAILHRITDDTPLEPDMVELSCELLEKYTQVYIEKTIAKEQPTISPVAYKEHWQRQFPALKKAVTYSTRLPFANFEAELINLMRSPSPLPQDLLDIIEFDAAAIKRIADAGSLVSSGALKTILSRTQASAYNDPARIACQEGVQKHVENLVCNEDLSGLKEFTKNYESYLNPIKIPYSAVKNIFGYKKLPKPEISNWLSFDNDDVTKFAKANTLESSGLLDLLLKRQGSPHHLREVCEEALIQYYFQAIESNNFDALNSLDTELKEKHPYLTVAQKGEFFMPFERLKEWLISSLISGKIFNPKILEWASLTPDDVESIAKSNGIKPYHLIESGFLQAILHCENQQPVEMQNKKMLEACKKHLGLYFSSPLTVADSHIAQATALLNQFKDQKGNFSNLAFHRYNTDTLSSSKLAEQLEATLWITKLNRMTKDNPERASDFVNLFPFSKARLETINRVEDAIMGVVNKWLKSLPTDADNSSQLLRINALFEKINKSRPDLFASQLKPDATNDAEVLFRHFISTKNWNQITCVVKGDLSFKALINWDCAEKMKAYLHEHLSDSISTMDYDGVHSFLQEIAKIDIVLRADFTKIARTKLKQQITNHVNATEKLESHPIIEKLGLKGHLDSASAVALKQFKKCFDINIHSKELVSFYKKLIRTDKKKAFDYIKGYLLRLIELETNHGVDLTRTALLLPEISRIAEMLDGFHATSLLDQMKIHNEPQATALETQLESFKACYPAWLSLLNTASAIRTQSKAGGVSETLSVSFGDAPSDSINWSIPEYVREFIRVCLSDPILSQASCAPSTRALPEAITSLLNNNDLMSVADAQEHVMKTSGVKRAPSRLFSDASSNDSGSMNDIDLDDSSENTTSSTAAHNAISDLIKALQRHIKDHPDMHPMKNGDFKTFETNITDNSEHSWIYLSSAALKADKHAFGDKMLGDYATSTLEELSKKYFNIFEETASGKRTKFEVASTFVISLAILERQIFHESITDEHAIFLLNRMLVTHQGQIPTSSKKYAKIIQDAFDTFKKNIETLPTEQKQTEAEHQYYKSLARRSGIASIEQEACDDDVRSNRSDSVSSNDRGTPSPALFVEKTHEQDNVLGGLVVEFNISETSRCAKRP